MWVCNVRSFIDSAIHWVDLTQKRKQKNCNRNTVKMRCLLSLPHTHFLSLSMCVNGIKSVSDVRVWPSSGSWNFPNSPFESNPVKFSSFQLNWIDPQPQNSIAFCSTIGQCHRTTHNSSQFRMEHLIRLMRLLLWFLFVLNVNYPMCVCVRPCPSPFRTASYMVNNPIQSNPLAGKWKKSILFLVKSATIQFSVTHIK